MFNHGEVVSQEYKKLVALLPRMRIGMVNIISVIILFMFIREIILIKNVNQTSR